MNFNANTGLGHPQGLGRKVKRISDVNAVGLPVPNQNSQFVPVAFDSTQPSNQFPNANPLPTMQNSNLQNQNMPYSQPQEMISHGQYLNYSNASMNPNLPQQHVQSGMPQPPPPNQFSAIPPQFTMLQQPIVQDMAIQYGQKLAYQGKQIMENQFEKWIPVTRLKYYFAVDNKYVVNKIRLLFFPFTHTDWSLKFNQDSPVQPRYDINAPDLYIPTMAYITYVVLAGLLLGMQNRFSPEQLGIQASSALAYSIFELVIYSITLYIANISTNLKTLDLVAFCGYKFVIIVACVLASTAFYSSGYYIALAYCSISLGFFLLRTLKTKVLQDAVQTPAGAGISYDPYAGPQPTHQFDYTVGRKRKLYFLFLVVGCEAFLSFWLSKHLILNGISSG